MFQVFAVPVYIRLLSQFMRKNVLDRACLMSDLRRFTDIFDTLTFCFILEVYTLHIKELFSPPWTEEIPTLHPVLSKMQCKVKLENENVFDNPRMMDEQRR